MGAARRGAADDDSDYDVSAEAGDNEEEDDDDRAHGDHDSSRLGCWTEADKELLMRLIQNKRPRGAAEWEVRLCMHIAFSSVKLDASLGACCTTRLGDRPCMALVHLPDPVAEWTEGVHLSCFPWMSTC